MRCGTDYKTDRACAVAAAAAHDWNDELTVILSSVDSLLETVGPDTRRAISCWSCAPPPSAAPGKPRAC